jgi:hypothetical protein
MIVFSGGAETKSFLLESGVLSIVKSNSYFPFSLFGFAFVSNSFTLQDSELAARSVVGWRQNLNTNKTSIQNVLGLFYCLMHLAYSDDFISSIIIILIPN